MDNKKTLEVVRKVVRKKIYADNMVSPSIRKKCISYQRRHKNGSTINFQEVSRLFMTPKASF
jgi:hypothetical protein